MRPPASPTMTSQWEAWSARSLPDVEEIRDGVWSVPVPIPDHPMRYTLSYVLVGGGETLVIDPGWESDQGWSALVAGLHRAGVDVADVEGIVVTHFHADHLGLAARLVRASGSWLAMGSAERLHFPEPDFLERARRKFELWGVPEEWSDSVRPDPDALATLERLATPDRWLAGGELLSIAGGRLRVLHTPGHSPGHICLADEERALLFTGDHVLPRITSHISYDPSGLDNPLADYLRSLDVVRLGEDFEVCPAHEYRFSDIADRCSELRAHTLDRAAEVQRVISDPDCETVWAVARSLTWSRGWSSLAGISMRLALAETASHLRYLEAQGIRTGVPLVVVS